MNPTPEQLNEFKEWFKLSWKLEGDFWYNDDEWIRLYNDHEAYHQHRLMEVEVDAPQLKSHRSSMGETGDYNVSYSLELNKNLFLVLSSDDEDDANIADEFLAKPYRKVAALQDMVKDLSTVLDLQKKDYYATIDQLAAANAEIKRLTTYVGDSARNDKEIIDRLTNELDKTNAEIERLKGERFTKPTDDDLIKFAIVFNDGEINKEKLADLVGFAEMIINRLYDRGTIMQKSDDEIQLESNP